MKYQLLGMICVILVFVGSLLNSGPLNGQESKHPSFGGVQLSEGTARLLHRVQSVYGQPVKAIDSSTLPDSTLAQATLQVDGTPVILFNVKSGHYEAQVAHELMHLLGWANGIPWPHFVSVSDLGETDPTTVRFLVDVIYDQVFHAYFYPKIRKLGVDPSVQEVQAIRKWIEKNEGIPTESGYLQRASLALYYFRCVAVLKDQQLADALATIFSENGQKEAVTMGQEMVKAVENPVFAKPYGVIQAFINCANIASAGHFRSSLWCVKPVQRGRIHQQIAIVAIEPVAPSQE